jgi:hypothetical protein
MATRLVAMPTAFSGSPKLILWLILPLSLPLRSSSFCPQSAFTWLMRIAEKISLWSCNVSCEVRTYFLYVICLNIGGGGIIGLPISWGDISTGKWLSTLSDSQNWDSQVRFWVHQGSDVRKIALAIAIPSNNWKLQTRPLVREGASYEQSHNCIKDNYEEKKGDWS